MPPSPLKRRKKVDVDFTLRRVFRKSSLRPLQAEVIDAALAGHDIFLCAATSFGKSLCYQLPAVVATGVTIVISPLLALMANQVNAARALGIPTESINGQTPGSERKRIETDLLCGHPETRLLYVTPELCAFDNFRGLLTKIHRQGQLVRVAIDEAHCISEWGHDFRPAYKDLIWLKKNLILPSVPIMAVTATATAQVRTDIFTYLSLKNAKVFTTTSARPNIHYEVQYFNEGNPQNGTDDVFPYLLSWLTRMHHRRLQANINTPIHGIIYTPTRALADTLSAKLTTAGLTSSPYHAGLDPQIRLKTQANFLSPTPSTSNLTGPTISTDITSSFNLITATTAFGMGIDAPHIRFVIHYSLPRNFESYIQESGRAGRDNRAASSIIFYTREDRDRCLWRARQDGAKEAQRSGGGTGRQKTVLAESKMRSLQEMIKFCESTERCKHELVGKYFGEQTPFAVDQDGGGKGVNAGVQCDYACDFHKEGSQALSRRKRQGLATDEDAMEYTQRVGMGSYDYY